jgi:hypothetical protein
MDRVTSQKAVSFLVVGGLLWLSLLLYFPPYATEFVGDDFVQVGMVAEWSENPARGIAAFNPGWSGWYYRPLQNLWFLLDRLFFGLNAAGYYGLHVLWHALATALVYATGHRLGLKQPASLVATALFAVHVQHHSVVSWLSSVAILMQATFSLAAFASYLHFRRGRPARRWLGLTVLFSVFALFSHEEGALLPPFLLAYHLFSGKSPRQSAERRTLLLLVAVAVVFGAIHFARPNLTLTVQGAGLSPYRDSFLSSSIAGFLATVVGNWTLLTRSGTGTALVNGLLGIPGGTVIFLLLLALLAWAAARRSQIARAGLLWAGLHLLFVYVALWVQRPELFAGRHLYAAGAGLVFALATHVPRQLSRGVQSVLALALLLWLGLQARQITADHRAWLAHTQDVARAEAQLREMLPQATATTRIFAHRFVLVPAFAPYAAAVWYGEPEIEGGSLQLFKAAVWLAPSDYFLDFEGGRLTNLMPELQEAERTRLLWQPEVRLGALKEGAGGDAGEAHVENDIVAGPAHDRRLATGVELGTRDSATLSYSLPEIPAGATLAVAFWGEPGLRYTAVLAPGKRTLLGEGEMIGEVGWQEMTVTLPETLQPPARLQLTVWSQARTAPGWGFWAIPRVTEG